MKVVLEQIALPHVNELHPSISTGAIGRALAEHYGAPVTDDLPDHLSVLLVRLEESDPDGEED
jgi:hypothetical protein